MSQKEKSLPRKVVNGTSRAGIGGGAILIGLALFLLFRGFGPGGTGLSGSGTSPEDGDGGKTMITTSGTPVTENPSRSLVVPDPDQGGLTDDEKKALSGEIFTVLIDEHNYLIELPGSQEPIFRLTPLDRVIELATMVTGDSNGTKVRILRRESSRASAEAELKFALSRNGIKEDAIIMPGDFVP